MSKIIQFNKFHSGDSGKFQTAAQTVFYLFLQHIVKGDEFACFDIFPVEVFRVDFHGDQNFFGIHVNRKF